MRLPFLKFGRTRTEPGRDLEKIRSAFSKFQRIQKLNTRVLEIMAGMERALGGEYIFDRSFLERSVREAGRHVYQVVYSLNALSENGYIGLFDRFRSVRRALEDVLAGGLGTFESRFALPFFELGLEMEPLAGASSACLAEVRNHLDIAVPDGFVATVTGCREFLRRNDGKTGRGAGSVLPPRLEKAILRERDALFRRCGGPVTLAVRACLAGEFGVPQLGLQPVEGVPPESLQDACRRALTDCIAAARAAGMENCEVALGIQETVPAVITGSASMGPAAGLLRVTSAPAAKPDEQEIYLVRRDYPHDLIRSDILAKDRREVEPGCAPLSLCSGGLRRGSAFVDPVFLKVVAGSAASIDRILGRTCQLKWARGDGGRLIILDVRYEAGAGDMELAEPADMSGTEVLLSGGETVQAGISAGRVAHISAGTDLEQVPRGAIVVARVAVPQLSRVLKRAAGIVTETGTSLSHLAVIARELRVPAVFGAAGALDRLPEGMEVTMDAGERCIHAGIVGPLLESRSSGSELFPNDPEYVLLRLLLRFVMPLSLIDPESRDFRVENCHTYHDIIHFCHEKSVEELLRLPDRHRGLYGLKPRRLEAGVPMDLYVLELDKPEAAPSDGWIRIDELNSHPFLAFIRGITTREMWENGAAAFNFRDIFANLDRTFGIMRGPEYAGRNLGVVAKNYMNLGLRLGYHQSVIDSYLGDNANQNYVYFRFAGGFADERRRGRRLELMRMILDGMHFKVAVKGDLLVGNFKAAGRAETEAVLTTLGQLTAFTRQLDTSLESESRIEEYARLFLARSIQAGEQACRESDGV